MNIVPDWVLDSALVIIALAIFFSLYRVVKGPTGADRAIGVDSMGVEVMAALSVYSLRINSTETLSAVLVIAILGFVGLMVMAKFLAGGDIIDRHERRKRAD